MHTLERKHLNDPNSLRKKWETFKLSVNIYRVVLLSGPTLSKSKVCSINLSIEYFSFNPQNILRNCDFMGGSTLGVFKASDGPY